MAFILHFPQSPHAVVASLGEALDEKLEFEFFPLPRKESEKQPPTFSPPLLLEDFLLLREEEDMIKRLLGRLNPEQRIVVRMTLSNHPVGDIARALNVSRSTVGRIREKAICRLRRMVPQAS